MCLRSRTSIENRIAAMLLSRSRYSTPSMLDSACAIAAATYANTPRWFSTSIISALWKWPETSRSQPIATQRSGDLR